MKIKILGRKEDGKKPKIDIPDNFLGEPVQGAYEAFEKAHGREKDKIGQKESSKTLIGDSDLAKKFGVENGIREPVLTGQHEALLIGAGNKIYAWDCKADQLYHIAERGYNLVYGFAQINEELFDVGGRGSMRGHIGGVNAGHNKYGTIFRTLNDEKILESDKPINALIAFKRELFHAAGNKVLDTLDDRVISECSKEVFTLIAYKDKLLAGGNNRLSIMSYSANQGIIFDPINDPQATPLIKVGSTVYSLTEVKDNLYCSSGMSLYKVNLFPLKSEKVLLLPRGEEPIFSLAILNDELYDGRGSTLGGQVYMTDTCGAKNKKPLLKFDLPVYSLFSLEKPMWDKVRDKARKA